MQMIYIHQNKLLVICIISYIVSFVNASLISIRGQNVIQNLPISLTKNWDTWTLENNILTKVENPSDHSDWVDPVSYDRLYLPADLPLPLCRPALGIALSNGIPRYIMPSIILSLETPERIWRNRGLCSLPRSNCWIDLFSPFVPSMDRLKLSYFGRSSPDVRFLEDQDGSSAWTSLLSASNDDKYRVFGYKEIFIKEAFESFETFLDSQPTDYILRNGYHYIDLILGDGALIMNIPKLRLKSYLTDLENPKRLLGLEDTSSLDSEPCGELDILISVISAGKNSEFLPKVYADLYDEGNILMN